METKIKFLGSGSAFVLGKENYQSNIVISRNSPDGAKNFLYDCGTTIADSLDASNLEPQDLDSIYISHLHADHAGGVEYIAFKTFFGQFPFGINKPNLYGYKNVLREGWANTWKGGLESIQNKLNKLDDYFNVNYMDDENIDFYGLDIKPIKTTHVEDSENIKESYGIMIMGNKTAFITGDTQYQKESYKKYYESDIIFQDCEFKEYPNSVHAQYHQLKTLDKEIKSKMWLYHYMLDGKTFKQLSTKVIQDGFAGLVKRGQEFTI